MTKNRIIATILILALFCTLLFTSCGETAPEERLGAEVGKWHTEYSISDIDDSQMSQEDKMLLSMLAGNVMFEIDAEFCADGTFTYKINTEALEKALSESVSAIVSFFSDIDLSVFAERLVEAAMQDAMKSSKSDYAGSYSKSEDGLIIAVDEENLYFTVDANRLIQVDEDGTEIINFEKVS